MYSSQSKGTQTFLGVCKLHLPTFEISPLQCNDSLNLLPILQASQCTVMEGKGCLRMPPLTMADPGLGGHIVVRR